MGKITKVDHVKNVLEARGYKRWICYMSVILHAHIHAYNKVTTSLTLLYLRTEQEEMAVKCPEFAEHCTG